MRQSRHYYDSLTGFFPMNLSYTARKLEPKEENSDAAVEAFDPTREKEGETKSEA